MEKKFFNSRNLKCFDCDQKYFVFIAEYILSRGSLARLKNLIYMMPSIEFRFEIVNDKSSPGGQRIQRVMVEHHHERVLQIPFILWKTASKSLIHFLFSEDRRKLKKCERCEKFFIQKKLDPRQKYCSEKCGSAARRLPPEEFKKYMQERRKKEWQQKKITEEAIIKKRQIQRFIKAGYSKEEAEQEWLRVREEMISSYKDFDL